jgi:hypothetical protein
MVRSKVVNQEKIIFEKSEKTFNRKNIKRQKFLQEVA